MISADSLGHIRVWDLGENSCSLELIPEQNTPIRTISMSADGATLVAANNKGNLYSWAVDSKTQEFHSMCTIKASAKYITRAVISPDMKSLATCSADHSVKMWNLPAKSLPGADITLDKVLSGAHQRWVWDCCFSADSAYLVTASSDHSAKLWDLASGEAIRNYAGHQKAVVCLALHDTLTT